MKKEMLLYLGASYIFVVFAIHWTIALLFWNGFILIKVNQYNEGLLEAGMLIVYAVWFLYRAVN